MKKYLIPLLDIAFLYLVYHIIPWPTAVLIYGVLILSIQWIVIIAVTIKLRGILANHKHNFSRSILDTFVIYLCSFTIYITSSHDIAHILAASTTVVFCLLYYIRYKTQQLF